MTSPKDTNDSIYQPGQEWSFHAREGEGDATLIICKVESHPKTGNIIHVSLRGLNIRNPLQKTGFSDEIAHLPFTEEAIDKSVVKMVNKSAKLEEEVEEDFKQAYEDWRVAFEQGKANVLGSSVGETLDYIESTINSDPDV